MITFTPGAADGWLLIARPGRLLFTRAGDTPGLADDLWRAIESDDPVQTVLERLTAAGLLAAPPFALARWTDAPDDALQLLVRGELVIEVETATTPQRVDASGVSTWRETMIDGAIGFRIAPMDGAPDAAATLPLESGAVPAASATVAIVPGTGIPVRAAHAATPAPRPAIAKPPAAKPPVADAKPPAAKAPAKPTPVTPPTFSEHTVQEATIAEVPVAPEPDAAEPDAPEPSEVDGNTYSHLFEETIVRSIEDAAVRPAEADDHAEPEVAAAGDHDGMTMMSGDIAELRGRKSAPVSDAPSIPQAPSLVLERPDGSREPLGQPVLVGRSPSVSKVSSGEVPRLVTITGNPDISRNHAQFTLEGDTVVVTDLHSQNGTSIALPGKSPQLLRQGEPTAVIVGTVIDLGGGITFTVKEGS
jgi:hypothetical protein